MKTINWSFLTSQEWGYDHPDCIKPLLPTNFNPFKNLSSDIVSSRKGIAYLKCPAHTDFLKNTFILCAPFDLTIDLFIEPDTDTIRIFCENISQEVFNTLIDTRFLFKTEQGIAPYPLLGVDWLPIFTSTDSILVQILPAFMHHNDFIEKTTIIPGEYDISKWTRPIETAFEVRSNVEKIVIKKGDALSYIKFHCDDTVKLINTKTPHDEMKLCNDIRAENTFRPLKERYRSLEEAREGKCPFSHN
jgi:hypothetical protein